MYNRDNEAAHWGQKQGSSTMQPANARKAHPRRVTMFSRTGVMFTTDVKCFSIMVMFGVTTYCLVASASQEECERRADRIIKLLNEDEWKKSEESKIHG